MNLTSISGGGLDIEEGLVVEVDKENIQEIGYSDDDEQTCGEQNEISSRRRLKEASESNSNEIKLSVVGTSDDSVEPNQRYIYLTIPAHNTLLSVKAESTDGIPSTVHMIPNQCAICLCDYEKGDAIVTSCSCPHAFHQECVVEWLAKMQNDTPCPCCRRSFVDLNTLNPFHRYAAPTNASQISNHRDLRRWRLSFRGQSTSNGSHDSVQEITEAERLRQEWIQDIIDQELRRRRAFNASVISLR